MTIEEIWTKTLAQIEVKLDSPAQFKTWFKDTKLNSIDGRHATIQVKNPYTSDWLRNRHEDMIRDTISYVAGKPLKLRFEVNGSLVEETTEEVIIDEVAASPLLHMESGIIPGVANVIRDAGLNDKYQMSKYIVGNSNRMAHAAALGVIDQPGTVYNPLFVYGPSGVGKTHLAQAIGIGLIERNPNRKILYSPAETFLNEWVKAMRKGQNLEFRQRYRKIDCLIIDDIQYISNWEKTQDEIFNTFNELYNANKQIILISDRMPEEIKNIDTRLKTRFMGGLTADIVSPDFPMRVAVIEQKMNEKGVQLQPHVIEFLAKEVTENIRELDGAVQKIALFSNMKVDGSPLTIQEIAKIIGRDSETKRKQTNVSQVLKAIAGEFMVKIKDIKGKRRTANVALARQVAMYILREEFEYKLEQIAQILDRKDHTTVMHGIDKIKSKMALSEGFSDQIVRLKAKIRELD